MGKRIDLSGQIFGDYKVIDVDNTKGKYKYYWNCECIHCQSKKSIASDSLKHNKSIRCNICNNKFGKSEPKGFSKDLTGQVFGYLTVDKFAYKKDDHSHWDCVCRCGNHVIKSIRFLHNGLNQMCDECIEKYKDINNVLATDNLDEDQLPIIVFQHTTNKKENTYEFKDDKVIINGEVLIDVDDYPLIKRLNRYIRVSNNGYALISYCNHDVLLSRIILRLPFGKCDTDLDIAEHRNGNRLDNTKDNLRICEKHINPINCKLYDNNTSGYKGVSWLERLQKWQAYLQCGKEKYYLGVYDNLEDAVQVRKNAEKKYFGEYNRKEEDLHNGYSNNTK